MSRPPGTLNRIPSALQRSVWEAIEVAGERLQSGPDGLSRSTRYLAWLATEHVGVFGAIVGKMLPKMVSAEVSHTYEDSLSQFLERRRAERLAATEVQVIDVTPVQGALTAPEGGQEPRDGGASEGIS